MEAGYKTFGILGNERPYESCPNCRGKSNNNYLMESRGSHMGDYSGKSSQSYKGASS